MVYNYDISNCCNSRTNESSNKVHLWINSRLNGALPTLPEITLLDGVPAIPGLTGSLTGAGGCLPKYMPLVNHESPNFFQNFLRFIPGAQDYLLSLIQKPDINANALIGKYQWVYL